MNKLVRALVDVLPRRFTLLDIGARDGLQSPWNMFAKETISAVLVEPDSEEADRLSAGLDADAATVLSYALWREDTTLTLRLTKSRGCSSVFLPNRAFLDRFPESDRFNIEKEVSVHAVTLDGLAEAGKLPKIDFAKIDVQGAELAILQGGRRCLAADLVGLEVEVEFAPMYEGQPLFGEVEAFVRERLGLEVWDIRKTYWKHSVGLRAGPVKGRLIFGDALFLRPVQALSAWLEPLGTDAAREKIAMLLVASLAYGYADYAEEILRAPDVSRLLTDSLRVGLEGAVRSVGRGFRPLTLGDGRLFILLDAVARAFKPDHNGWATVGQPLGSRRRGPFWT